MLSLFVVSKFKRNYFSPRNLVYRWCVFKVAQCIMQIPKHMIKLIMIKFKCITDMICFKKKQTYIAKAYSVSAPLLYINQDYNPEMCSNVGLLLTYGSDTGAGCFICFVV